MKELKQFKCFNELKKTIDEISALRARPVVRGQRGKGERFIFRPPKYWALGWVWLAETKNYLVLTMKNAFLILMIVFLCSCATREFTYNPDTIDPSLLAHIKMKEDNYTVEGKPGSQIQSWIAKVYDEKGKRVVNEDSLRHTVLPAGRYKIVGHCFYTGNYAYPYTYVELEAGATYYAVCSTITEKDPIFRWNIIKGWTFELVKEGTESQ